MKGKRITKLKLPASAGVYRATTPSGNFYIGRAVNMRQRMLNHYSSARLGTHPNQWLARSLNKYGHKVKWGVLFYSDNAENALEWERNYLDMFWGDPMLMNQKKGDQFTALENERSKRKPVYAMNLWSGGVIRLNYGGEWGSMVGQPRWASVPGSVYGKTINECNQKRRRKIQMELARQKIATNERQLVGYHIRNIHTGYVGYAKDVYELKRIGAASSFYSKTNSFKNGWQVRKIGSDWSFNVPIIKKDAVYGLHVTGEKKQWMSKRDCEKELGNGAGLVFIGKLKTYKGWLLRDNPGYR